MPQFPHRGECPVSSKHLENAPGPSKRRWRPQLQLLDPAAPSQPRTCPSQKCRSRSVPFGMCCTNKKAAKFSALAGRGGEEEGNLPANEISLFPACVGRQRGQQWVAWLTTPRAALSAGHRSP